MTQPKFYLETYRILYGILPKQIVLMTVNSVLSVPYAPLELFLIKEIIDKFQNSDIHQAYTSIILLAIALAACMFVYSVLCGSFNALALSILQEKGDVEKDRMILEKSTKLHFVDVESSITAHMRDRAMKVSFISIFQEGTEFFSKILLALVLLAILTVKGSWVLTLVTCLVTVLSIWICAVSSKRVEQLARKQTSSRYLMNYLYELLSSKNSMREIRIFNAGMYLRKKWTRIFHTCKKETVRQGTQSEGFKLLSDLFIAITSGVFAVLIVVMVNQRGGTAGDFLLLFQSALLLYNSLPGIISLAGGLKASSMRWNDFQAFLHLSEEESGANESKSLLPSLEAVVKNLTFRYPDAKNPSLCDVSFRLPAGSSVALVGENGAGKTTLVKLLLGLYKPEKGSVRWFSGGNQVSFPTMRQDTSVIFQDFARFHLTVRENVAMGEISSLHEDEKLVLALKEAQAHAEFDSLDRQLGADFGGMEPSGGQWQRLAASRAYLHNGTVVFFDEPTAALDPKAEERAFSTFLDMTRGKTAVLVTHRLGAARLADFILVLKKGRLVEQGTHEELLCGDGEYARMYALQASWYAPGEAVANGAGNWGRWSG